MQKIFYFLHVLCLLFALQTTAAEPAVATALLENGMAVASLADSIDDSLTADFGSANCCVDMLEISEVDVDKLLLPGFFYPIHKSTYQAPEHYACPYALQLGFWLDRPPQLS